MFTLLVVFLFVCQSSNGITSSIPPFTAYDHSVELQVNVSDLWWTVDETNRIILFELHTHTTGWIALGISPVTTSLPLIDNTTTDWFALQGREQNGWTAIQFTCRLDTCDIMDVAITSGTNYHIFAYGLVDPSLRPPVSDITYHETRRGEYILSLRSYIDPPLESKFAQLDYFDFRLNNHKIIIESTELQCVHHLLMYECDPAVQFNDSNLPDDLCDNIHANTTYCTLNIATGRAIGGQQMSEFPSVAGYPVGGNFSIKYYLLQIHYNNPNLCNNCTDSSGIRFYVGNELRQYDIGYFTFGGDTSVFSLSIPPQVENFAVDSYRRLNASSLLPPSGITIVTAFPHTHLQGKSVWTKLIRNKTAVQYLFDADSYDFNYQFEHKLPEPIQLYPDDEFITRCVYNTMNKNGITLGEGERTQDEMCLHMFTYYPRVNNIYECFSRINATAWGHFFKLNFTPSTTTLQTIFIDISWTLNLAVEWQNFYNNASRVTYYGGSGNLNIISLSKIPKYVDLKQETCTAQSNHSNSTNISPQCGLATRHKIFIILLFVPFLMKIIIDL